AAAAYESILALLARRRPAGSGGAGAAGEVSEAAASSRSAILDTLGAFQVEYDDAAEARFHQEVVENVRVDAAVLTRLKETLVEERERIYDGVDRRKVASADNDTINLVGMLFDYILQDEQLPNAVKALLSRLQTPFIRVAILDRELFTEKQHPARRLLDQMADAGARWVTEDDLERGIFPAMRLTVDRVLREFKDDLGLFDELLTDFAAQLHEVEQKVRVIERRAVETADGQARLQNARQQAIEAIDRLLRTARLAAEPRAFMQQVWTEKLTFILLREREGLESQAWRLALKLADQLVLSLRPQADAEARGRLQDVLPGLRTELREGLEALQAYGRRDNDKMFAQICAWQDQVLATPPTEPTVESAVEPAVESGMPGEVPPTELAGQPVVDEASLPAAVQALAEQLATLAFNTWFEFIDPETGIGRRLKLAWYSTVSSNYMFVDATGVKAAEYPRGELARRLHAGQARIINMQDKPFLDRALETILGWLGRDNTQAST
ncbi:MAG: DUF1631 family protein, partial [Gammaproteobacteria bacterium]